MKCYVCLMEVGASKEMVGLCTACGVALCAGHFTGAGSATQGGMHYTCNHSFPTSAQVARTEAVPDGAAAQYVAACKHCGIALTLAGVAELAKHTQGGMRYGCPHTARAQVPA